MALQFRIPGRRATLTEHTLVPPTRVAIDPATGVLAPHGAINRLA